jgi:hypothetical protein
LTNENGSDIFRIFNRTSLSLLHLNFTATVPYGRNSG